MIDKTHRGVNRVPLNTYNYKYSVGDYLTEDNKNPRDSFKYKVVDYGFFMSPEPNPEPIPVYILEVIVLSSDKSHCREKSATWVDSACRPLTPAERVLYGR